jgi:heme/copper-type cytochrome/quinol oxidase subunit 3
MLVSEIVPFRPPRRPRDVTAYIGMVIFLGGWAMLFAALFFSYGVVRVKASVWPPAGDLPLPRLLPGVNTLVMLGSSATLALGLRSIRNARPAAFKRWLAATIALGVTFCALQAVVWHKMLLAGLLPSTDIYGSVFYLLTCFHALHVLVGIVGLVALLPRALKGSFTAHSHTPVRMWSMYWHFVDAIWVLMFVTVYLY